MVVALLNIVPTDICGERRGVEKDSLTVMGFYLCLTTHHVRWHGVPGACVWYPDTMSGVPFLKSDP